MLRVLAVSAPHWERRPVDAPIRSFTAGTAFSLQNACRQSATAAQAGRPGWADSNWRTIQGRRESLLLLEFMDEARTIVNERVDVLRPNMVLIGAMTLGMPGAVEIARIVRDRLGNDVLIVLGGRHASETLRDWRGEVWQAPHCPVRVGCPESPHTCDDERGPLFDVVVSGQGEDVIERLGALVADVLRRGRAAREAVRELDSALSDARGLWIAAWVDSRCAEVRVLKAKGLQLAWCSIPTAPAMFGVQSAFAVFDGIPTGHAYSDMSRGCHYDCHFCSERHSLNGRLDRSQDPVGRLVQHVRDIRAAVGSGPAAAFVEDSVLLGGDLRLVSAFCNALEAQPTHDLRIGVQLTVHDIERFAAAGLLQRLRAVGVEYVAFGMETSNEHVAAGMSKYEQGGEWVPASVSVLETLDRAGLRSGVFVLWGLGETQDDRTRQLMLLQTAQQRSGGRSPSAVGFNWAVLHPAATDPDSPSWQDGVSSSQAESVLPDFLAWGTPSSDPRHDLLQEYFGEASVRYPLYPGHAPTHEHLLELVPLMNGLLEGGR